MASEPLAISYDGSIHLVMVCVMNRDEAVIAVDVNESGSEFQCTCGRIPPSAQKQPRVSMHAMQVVIGSKRTIELT